MKNVSIIEAEATVDAPKPQRSPSERSQHAAAREARATTPSAKRTAPHLLIDSGRRVCGRAARMPPCRTSRMPHELKAGEPKAGVAHRCSEAYLRTHERHHVAARLGKRARTKLAPLTCGCATRA